MHADTNSSPAEREPAEQSNRSGVFAGMIAWLLAAISAGLGLIGIASCGIPFVPPASTLAIILGTMGGLAAITAMAFAFLSRRKTKLTFVVLGVVLLALNGLAISLGRLGKHLIDWLEGH